MRLFLFFLFAAFPATLFSQTTLDNASKKAVKYYRSAFEELQKNDFEDAIEELLKAVEEEPEFLDAHLALGEVYYYQKKDNEALTHLDKVISLDRAFSSKSDYLAGKIRLEKREFDNSIAHFEAYLNHQKATPNTKKEVEGLLLMAKSAKEAEELDLTFSPENMGQNINSSYHEYQPFLRATEDFLVYTRRRGLEEDFYTSVKQDDQWRMANTLGPPVSSEGREGSITLAPDGKTVFFAAESGDPRRPNWDLFYSEWQGNNWSEPEKLSSNVNSSQYESQPSISADGRTLYFVSKRAGGLGGLDIWYVEMQDDCSWGNPVNMGPNVNTPGDEQVPFIHPDGQTLYFGSNGHPGLGGSDLYILRRGELGEWGTPENMGYPINTAENEGSIFVTANGKKGYFASDRQGGYGGLDIYNFEMWERIQPQPVTYVIANLFDEETKEPVQADFELIELKTGEVVMSSKCNEYLKDNFLIILPAENDYALNIFKTGYLFHSENFQLPEKKDYEPVVLDIYLKPLKVGNTVVLKNIFFETDKYALKSTSQAELDQLVEFLQQNPTLKIEISGHTDNVGSAQYNQTLSEQRAKAVYDYLVENGIKADRLSYKGYGSTEPVATNDTEEGRAQNRRTEFKVIAR